ncbi:MAG: energy-coupling factor transporter transmembrane protein EcfT [Actinobacteria bacterium]|nr:energy-coupling factor transporter transmembrane protein EcfT [Actinomycetota bacterium]MBU1943638.1 energy-coupling factor transporter transmembrane protein EcfT [Actinomycetota bacterium]MBU2687527.1 energy-coupling factor transporter transmembrane protein EcfT [Actinomycetota bacterium]
MIGRDITIGQYLASDTLLHHVDPRLKVLAVIASTVLVFVYSGWALLAFAGLLVLLLVVARLPLLKVLKSLPTVWVIAFITFMLQAFLTPGEVIWHWGFLSITDTGLSNGLLFSGRILLLVVVLAALTMTTPPLKLADALESLLKPLSYLKVPVWRVTTVVSITLMFIPNILEESRKITRAQMARGADFESANLLRRVRDIIPVLVPLFVRVFRDADELAVAMDARAYAGGEKRTRLYPLKIGWKDSLGTVVFLAAALSLTLL